MIVRRARSSSKQSLLVYSRAALTHAVQLGPLLVVAGVALFTLSIVFTLLALVAMEVVVVAVVPRAASFQESVDRELERRSRAEVIASRRCLAMQMAAPHVAELTELEHLVEGMRRGSALAPLESAEVGVERLLALDRLLVSYVRLAIAFRRSAAAFSSEGRQALDRVASDLAFASAVRAGDAPLSEHARWLEHRRAVVSVRQATWTRAKDDRETMANALTTIADVVRAVHEVAAASRGDEGREETDRLLAGCLAELTAIRRLEEDVFVDSRIFAAPVPGDGVEPERSGSEASPAVGAPEAGARVSPGASVAVGLPPSGYVPVVAGSGSGDVTVAFRALQSAPA